MALKGRGITTAGVLVAVAAAALTTSPVSAAVTAINTSSTVFDVALTVFGTPVDVGPELPASGSAPPLFNQSNSLASFSGAIGPLSFTTGVLVDTASGDTTAAAGTASSSLASLDIALDDIATITATAVSSTSSVDGTPSATGSSTLADLMITIAGSSISIPFDPSPNDVIFDADGITVTLNQQIHEVGGSIAAGIVTNAIAIDFADRPEVRGHIDIARSMASIGEAAVPELSTWAMMAFGFGALALASWRRRKLATIG